MRRRPRKLSERVSEREAAIAVLENVDFDDVARILAQGSDPSLAEAERKLFGQALATIALPGSDEKGIGISLPMAFVLLVKLQTQEAPSASGRTRPSKEKCRGVLQQILAALQSRSVERADLHKVAALLVLIFDADRLSLFWPRGLDPNIRGRKRLKHLAARIRDLTRDKTGEYVRKPI